MPPMVSEEEIEREVRTLKNLRRRSASSPGPGALPLDPDLPPRDAFALDAGSSSTPYSSNDDVTLATPDGLDGDGGLFWVPAHLHPELAPGEFRAFLKQHTQVDPVAAEAGETGEASLSRSPSWLSRSNSRSSALGRKKSMLSRQYNPRAGDKVEEERPPLPNRPQQRGSIFGGRGGDAGLTLDDLQKLEELVDEAELSEDPEQMRKLLRRSLSLSMDQRSGYSDDTVLGNEADEAILQPPPGSIIRRTARTKIRKSAVPGPDGVRRFSSSRRNRVSSPSSSFADDYSDDLEGRRSDETSEERSSESPETTIQSSIESGEIERGGDKFYDSPQHIEGIDDRRKSDEDESNDEAIFDAYARDGTSTSSSVSSLYDGSRSPSPEEQERMILPPILPPIVTPEPGGEHSWFEDGERTPTQESSRDPLHGIRRPSPGTDEGNRVLPRSPGSDMLQIPFDQHRPQPPPAPTSPPPQSSPSVTRPKSSPPDQYDLPPGMAPPAARSSMPPGMGMQQRQGTPAASPSFDRPALSRTDSGASAMSAGASSVASGSGSSVRDKEKAKEKEKKGGLFSKKDKKDKDKDKEKDSKKKDKDRFLGSLFGSKKKHEEPSSVANFSTAGPAAAAALLGTSKSAKSLGLHGSGTSSPTSPAFSHFARYPIHVERAVYRLSHIKLANARRPLIEQVLISNLMFWYLGVIGRTPGSAAAAAAAAEDKRPGTTNGLDKDRDEAARQPQLKGTPSKPADTGSAGVKRPDVPPQAAQPARKAGLSKPERSRTTTNNEAAYRAPQYGMQNAQMDKEMRVPPGEIRGPAGQGQIQKQPLFQQQQPPSQISPQHMANQQPPNNRPPSISPQFGGPPGSPRAGSNPPLSPNRARSPPSSAAQQQRPEQFPAMVPRELQGPPRGLPQSSFGPPPPAIPGQGQPRPQHGQPLGPSHGPSQSPLQGAADPRDPRQRTLSHPNQVAHHPPPGLPSVPGMRRVVTEGHPQPYPASASAPGIGERRPGGDTSRSGYPPHGPPQHSGPQPGQIFQYPGMASTPGKPFPPRTSGSPQPGQLFGAPQPGQLFHHPQFSPRPPPPQLQSTGGQQGWEPPQRLPPGVAPQQWLGQPGPQPPLRRVSPGPPDPYARAQAPYSPPREGGSPTSPTHQGAGFYQRPQPQQQGPGQVYGQYPVGPPGHPAGRGAPSGTGGGSGDDSLHRRVQPVPPGTYPQHR